VKYQCCFCTKIFPSNDSIDGYKLGYKVGFLCPFCNKNIKDDLVSTETVYEDKKTNKFVAFVGTVFIPTGFLLPQLDGITWIHYLIFGSAFLISVIYGYAKYGDDLFSQTCTTQPGPGK
jgi:hypothetical protein